MMTQIHKLAARGLAAAALAVAATSLAGCVPSTIEGKLQTFQQVTPDLKGKSVAIVASPPERNSTLEFAAYRKLIEPKLAQQGFVITDDVAHADMLAVVSYGIDSGHTETQTYEMPQYGQTSPGGTTYYNGTINTMSGPMSYSGTGYTQPTYGITGSTPVTVHSQVYNRFIAMQIVDGKALDQQKITPYYEGRLTSAGACGSLPAVFPKLVDGLFQNWPQPSGSTTDISVPADDVKC